MVILHLLFEALAAPFTEFAFMQRAMVGCLALSLSAPLVGVFLLLHRMSLSGDAMAHAILPGAAVGFLIAGFSVITMTIGGLVAGITVAILTGVISRQTDTNEDANMAAFYLISLALGVFIISNKGSNIDLLHVLFGSVLGLDDQALILLLIVSCLTMLAFAIFYRALVLDALDRGFLQQQSARATVTHLLLLLLIVFNLVAGFHALGTLMSVGLMVLPAAVARFWAASLDKQLILSVLLALSSCYLGLVFSYHFSWATSPVIVMVLGCQFVLALLFGWHKGILTQLLFKSHRGHYAD